MDMRQLRYFVQIVESGSLSKASRQLFIAQPALSQRMAQLEEEVGKSLLVRSVRGVVPTQNGEALYHHAKFVLLQLDEAVLIARREYSDVRGRVTVGMASSTASMVGLPLLRELKEKYPGILLNVLTARPGLLEEKAKRGELDVAILFGKVSGNDMTFEPLLEEDVFVILPQDSKLVPARKTSLTLVEAAALPMVLSAPTNNHRRKFMLELERANLEANVVAEIDSLSLVMRYVAEGGGATIQVVAATQAQPLPQGWRCLPIVDAPISRTNYLYALPVQKLSASISLVRSELKRLVHRLVDDGTWLHARLLGAPEEPNHHG
ncbi:LysR substrate-binding domain-containing protein [Variovorax rhizosphaerae]|uniref:LysR substrate-binding domain-containing protein n=1 Tax=Variovorax rhizosphaerae TaxID=1836200 RepID=A0ABU8WT80_9BURK